MILIRVHRGILRAAGPPVLLAGPADHAHRAPGPKAQLLHEADRFPGGDNATSVVHRALAHVPRVYVTTENDDLVRELRPDDLRDVRCR